jgi:hypothetical protein
MKSISLLFVVLSTSVFGQYQFSNPINLTGTDEGARTVHFSDDGTRVFGDWDQLTEWSIQSKSIVKSSEIVGYNTHKSAFDGQSIWMSSNVNYNTEKKDITDTHSNINIIDGKENTPNKTVNRYDIATFIPETKDVIIAAISKTNTYSVVRLSTETLEESTLYFDKNKDGVSVPAAIKVSDDGKYVAIGMAGETSGVRIYGVKEGNLVAFIPTTGDVNDLAFTQNGEFLFIGSGTLLVQLKTSDWTREKAWEFSSPISTLDVNSTGSYIAFSFQGAGAILVDTSDGAILAQLSGGKVSDITFSNDDKYIGLGVYKTLKSKEVPAIILYKKG